MFTSLAIRALLNDLKKDYDLNAARILSLKYSKLGYYIMKLYTFTGRLNLLIDTKNKIFLPVFLKEKSEKIENTISNFFKKTSNININKFDQIDLERILYIDIGFKNRYKIFIELFGKGNFVVTNEDNIILVAEYEYETQKRRVRKGSEYIFPKLIDLNYTDLSNVVREKSDLFRYLPIDPFTLNYILYKLEMVDTKLSENDLEKIYNHLVLIINQIDRGDINYVVIKDYKNKYTVLPYTPDQEYVSKYGLILYKNKDYREFSEYFVKELYPAILNLTDSKYRKIQETILKMEDELAKLNKKLEDYQMVAPSLYSKIDELYKIFDEIKQGKTHYKIDTKNKLVYIKVNDLEVPLPYNQNPYKAIGYLYDEIKRMKKGVRKLNDKINELRASVGKEVYKTIFLDAYISLKKKWFEKYIWSISTNDFLIIGGKDARTNELIIKKYATEDDIIFHADIRGSPFVILKEGLSKNADYIDMYDAAYITASYSKAWQLGLSSIAVYYVKKDQLSKHPPTGEYLRTGSFMIYGKRNYIKGVPLVLYIAITQIDNFNKIFIGSESAIKKHSIAREVFRLIPGDFPRGSVAKKIIDYYLSKNYLDKKYYEAYYNDLITRVPPNSYYSITKLF